jgi:hypothetical protein
MSGRAGGEKMTSFRRHLSLRLLSVGLLAAGLSALTLYYWESTRDLRRAIETVRHYASFIADETIAINLDGGNIVYVENALEKIAELRPALYARVADPAGKLVAHSVGYKTALAEQGADVVLVELPITEHSSTRTIGKLTVALSGREARRAARHD